MTSSGGGGAKAKPARHVYKTGAAGCGGKAAPTAAKNSGSPLPCPFCDRIFKQDGRLKEHLKNKHAEENQAGASVIGESESVVGGPCYTEQGQRDQSGYPIKTPKTLLHEWCQKNKRPVPKFKHVEVEGGFHCRIILPDPKDNDADVILWYKDSVTHSSQEAQHRAAVVGLHRILGNRRLDRILPEEYRQQWHNLDLAAEEQKASLKAHPSTLRPKPTPRPEELHSVFMSENNRRLVEGLLKAEEKGISLSTSSNARVDRNCIFHTDEGESRYGVSRGVIRADDSWRHGEIGHASVRSEEFHAPQRLAPQENNSFQTQVAVDSTRVGSLGPSVEVVRQKLLSMGFKQDYVNLALIERRDLPRALDWLILNVPEQELPAKYAPEASKASVQVLVRGKAPMNNVSTAFVKDSVSYLQECGYSFCDCVAALSNASGDEDYALCSLFKETFLSSGVPLENGNADEQADIAEEVIALHAIFGEEAMSLSNSCLTVEIALPDGVEARLEMEVRLRPGLGYPHQIPVITFRSKELPSAFLLALTRKVVDQALQLLGTPMIYYIVDGAGDLAQDLIREFVGDNSSAPYSTGSPSRSKNSAIPGSVTSFSEAVQERSSNNSLMSLDASDELSAPTAYRPPAMRMSSDAFSDPEHCLVDSGRRIIPSDSRHIQASTSLSDPILEREKLRDEWERLRVSACHSEMWETRKKLPAFQAREKLVHAINHHSVVIVAGQTGCGKSTQIPQYVLEDNVETQKGVLCNIICTQPRRLSAIGLADRVARERGQAVGDVVGYSVRLESCRSWRTRLLFCTTGIFLRRLLSDPDLLGVTHVIIDEVHERSLESDLLLLLLRQRLKRCSDGSLRLILMSATVDTALFAGYFKQELNSQPAIVSIPGFTFPVRELFLEDIFELTGYRVGKSSRYALKKNSSTTDLSELASAIEVSAVDVDDTDTWESRVEDEGKEEAVDMDGYSEATIGSLKIVDQNIINYDLIEALICCILQDAEALKITGISSEERKWQEEPKPVLTGQQGAVLVFLPGMQEIRRLQSKLQSSSQISCSGPGSLWVLPVHGSLSGEEQKRVFIRPPPGVRKVVLATNIAETSITIDDVVYVIDTGRHKEMRYDHSKGLSCLADTWVSKASAKQRRGRAGRVQPGCCLRLFSRQQFQKFDDQQLPEILRVSLDGLCLKVKSLLSEKVETAVSKIITPPDMEAVRTSLKSLKDLNALDTLEKLTPLGQHLARMPVDAHVGKMLLFGCMLKCLDPVLTIAAALSGRSPFFSPMEKREEARAARSRFAGGSKSDHMTIVSAYNGWLDARQDGRNAEVNYCTVNFLSRETLASIEASRLDFLKILVDIGFIPELQKGVDYTHAISAFDTNTSSIRVVKSAICAGFYPNIVRVHHPEKTYVQTEGGTVAKMAAARELRFFSKVDGRVFLHPASVNFSVGCFESPWLVFSEKVKTSKVFVKESTMVPAYGLLLFGGKVVVKHEKQSISVDDWLEFEAPARISVLIRELRMKVDSLLLEKTERPSLDISSSPVVAALIKLLTKDGF